MIRKVLILQIAILAIVASSLVHAEGDYFVANAYGNQILRFDAVSGENKPSSGNTGAVFADEGMNHPIEPVIGPDGDLYVANFYGDNITRYDGATGAYKGIWASGLNNPAGILFHNGYAYVSCRYVPPGTPGANLAEDSCVMKLDAITGQIIDPLFADLIGTGQMYGSFASMFLPDSRFLTLEIGGNFLLFDASGGFLYKQTIYDGNLVKSADLDMFLFNGYFYTSCLETNQVRRFSYTLGATSFPIDTNWGLSGGSFGELWGCDLGPDYCLYVTDRVTNTVQKFNAYTGQYIGDFLSAGQGGLSGPHFANFTNMSASPASVQGTVILKDWVGPVEGIIVSMDISTTSGSIVETHNVTLSNTGFYSFTTDLRGEYTIVAKASHWLPDSQPITIMDGENIADFTLINGDINGDGVVDELDYALLSNSWYQAAGDPAYNPDADLNGDGGVDEIDYAILSNAWYTDGGQDDDTHKLLFWDSNDIHNTYGQLLFKAEPLADIGTAPGYPIMRFACTAPRAEGGQWVYGYSFFNDQIKFYPYNPFKIIRCWTLDGVQFHDAQVVFSDSSRQWLGFANIVRRETDGALFAFAFSSPSSNIVVYSSYDGVNWQLVLPYAYADHDACNIIWDPRSKSFINYQTAHQPWTKKYPDNIGGSIRRVMSFRTSQNGINWNPSGDWGLSGNPSIQLWTPDQYDPGELEFYRMCSFIHEGRYVSLMTLYAPSPQEGNTRIGTLHGPGLGSEWCFSRDGLQWERPYRGTDATPEGSWVPVQGPLRAGGMLRFYAGVEGPFMYGVPEDRLFSTFCRANGEFSTDTFTISGQDIVLNFKADRYDSYVLVELRDEQGNIIPGFERQKCVMKGMDEHAYILRWNGVSASSLAGRIVSARLYFRNANIYSLEYD